MTLDFNHYSSYQNGIAQRINDLIDDALQREDKNKEKRGYIGPSRLGISCSRLLQYEYENVPKDDGADISGKFLRIFEVGHMFESIAINWLKRAGFDLLTHDANDKQLGFKVANGKIAGHVDGIIVAAPPVLKMKLPCVWECKSMNSRSWKDTAKRGLTISSPIYAAQIALYMAYMEESFSGISQNPALFTCVNKDTCQLYHELIAFDKELAQRMSDKAVTIINASKSGEVMPRVASTPDFYECKVCSYHKRCWEKEKEVVRG